MSEQEHDPVNHPKHYTSHPSGVEVIEYTRLLPFGPGNAVKYVMRRGQKGDAVEDIDKAIWYLRDSIENDVTYRVDRDWGMVIDRVIEHEKNMMVRVFLASLYYPDDYLRPHFPQALQALQRLRAREVR